MCVCIVHCTLSVECPLLLPSPLNRVPKCSIVNIQLKDLGRGLD